MINRTQNNWWIYHNRVNLICRKWWLFVLVCCYPIRGFTLSISVLILHIFRQLLLWNRKISSKSLLWFKPMQRADSNNSYFTNISVLHIFKVVLYVDSPVINSQIRYSVTANIESFLESPYGFLYADSLWLVVERAFTR